MAEFYILNEVAPATDPFQPGAINVFPSADSVTLYVEPWFVDETYLLLSSSGRRQQLALDGERLSILPHQDQSDYSSPLKTLLVHHLRVIEQSTTARKKLPSVGKIEFADFDARTLFRIAFLLSD
jgi:hypothetical protein